MPNDRIMPPLPSGSVDLTKLHAADDKGHDLAEAVTGALSRKGAAAARPAKAIGRPKKASARKAKPRGAKKAKAPPAAASPVTQPPSAD